MTTYPDDPWAGWAGRPGAPEPPDAGPAGPGSGYASDLESPQPSPPGRRAAAVPPDESGGYAWPPTHRSEPGSHAATVESPPSDPRAGRLDPYPPRPEPLPHGQAHVRARAVIDELEKVIVGKRSALELVLMGVLSGGHVLLEDLPGTGKTVLARSFAQVLGLSFTRVQFTPDLLPQDLTGAALYQQRTGEFQFREGPVFTHFLLADEINRTPPKTQAALLEAMEERQVTADGVTRRLPDPFVVLATENPIEYEGTYPLPEAQLDRFVLRTRLGYLDPDHEVEMARRRLHRGAAPPTLSQVTEPSELLAMIGALERIEVHDDLLGYIVALVQATREHPKAQVGASPRGTLAVTQLARGAALLAGRDYVTPEDVQRIAAPALGHRIVLRPELWVRRVTGEDVVAEVLEQVPTPSTRPTEARVRA